jgi:hypothetical protein
MAQFTVDTKYPSSTAINQAVLFDTERRKGKRHVILADIGPEFLSIGITTVENSAKKSRGRR